MGEKDVGKDVSGEKKSDAFNTVVLKIDMHCEGCSKKIKRFLRKIEGVKEVKIDGVSNKLSMSGAMEVDKVVKMLAEKMKRKVDVISPQQKKKEATGDSNKPVEEKKKKESKDESSTDSKKPEAEKKKQEKKSKEISAILKIKLHCEGCMHRIKKSITNFKGVQDVNLDADKDQVSVKGTMDLKEMVPFLADKFRRAVDLVQPNQSNVSEKKSKPADADGGGGGGGGKEETKGEVRKMEYQGYPQGYGHVYGQGYWMGQAGPSYGYGSFEQQQQMYNYNYNPGYITQPQHVQAPQMFSDENPNACSVM